MKFKTTFRLFIAVCLLGGLVFLVDHQSRLNQRRDSDSHLIFDVAMDPVIGIKIVRNGNAIGCIKKGHDWFLKEPVRARGNASEIERISAMLEESRWSDSISFEQRKSRGLDLSDYGLKSPEVVVTVETGLRSMTLFLGDEMPMGGGTYARLDHSDAVLIVPSELGSMLPTSIEPLRDYFVLHGKVSDTVRLEIERKDEGFIQLVRQDGVWMIQQPLSARADAVEVQLLLDSLYKLDVKSFVWDVRTNPEIASDLDSTLEMASSARTESCGLATDTVQMRVTIWVDGDSLGQELLIGKPDPNHEGTVFAKRSENDAIFSVDKDVLRLCGIDLNLLRDSKIFYAAEEQIGYIALQHGETRLTLERNLELSSGWRVIEPVQWDADAQQVHDLFTYISSLTVHSYLEQTVDGSAVKDVLSPRYSVAIGSAAPSEEESAEEGDVLAGGGKLLIGGECAEKELCFSKMVDSDEIFMVQLSGINWLNGQEALSPLSYRNRSILDIEPSHVRRIDVATSSGVSGVERSSTQNWSCVGCEGMVPDLGAIRLLLVVMSDFRAEGIEVHNPKSLDKYGLSTPFATVTLGLQGEDNIQKSLLLGKKADGDELYAMVRGQDLVFVVSKDIIEPLLAPISVAGKSADSPVVGVD